LTNNKVKGCAVSDIRDYIRSLERSRAALEKINRPMTFSLHQREWDILPGVFSPVCSPTTGVVMELLGLDDPAMTPRTGSFLEIGCGAGLVAVSSALGGCDRVVASDINSAAVDNTALNAERHGVADRIRVLRSDLFDEFDPHERFDTIFWSSNYVLAPAGYEYRSMHERAYVDAGYATHRRFLTEAPRWLTATGSVVLHFSDRGDLAALLRIADECGRGLRALRGSTCHEGVHDIGHMLLEVTCPQSSPLAVREQCARC
jgi:release factor glutamine methyltransferase